MTFGVLLGSISRRAGGLFQSVRGLSQALQRLPGAKVHVLSLNDPDAERDLGAWRPLEPRTFPAWGPLALGYSPQLVRAVSDLSIDVLHTHGIWQGLSIASHRWHCRTGRPYVISTRGMLDPWALRNAWWKKRVALALYERRHLRDAACLHALCESERDSFRRFGLAGPVAVIPNGVTLPERTSRPGDGPRRLVFLGRMHPKKGVAELIGAWRELPTAERRDWRLVIAGWDDGGCEAGLRRKAAELGLGETVEFAGPQFGAAKEELLATAAAFVLPSFSEGLPMAVLEAWSYGLPVAMTEHCNLPEGVASEAAVQVAPEASSIAAGLRVLMRMSDGERAAMGARGRGLVERRFAWPEIAARMAEVYRWVLGGGARPACVETV